MSSVWHILNSLIAQLNVAQSDVDDGPADRRRVGAQPASSPTYNL